MKQILPTFRIYTLGCKVNQYESESISEEMMKNGFALSDGETADIYIINTCTVTGESDRKSGQIIRRARQQNTDAGILVCGCFSQVSPERVAAIGGIDYICGSADKMSVVSEATELIRNGKRSEPKIYVEPHPEKVGFDNTEITSFPRTRAYIKIEDGCNNRCAYCIIPTARGKVRSKKPEDVISEINKLTEGGCPEIVLTGIETDAYGLDLEHYRLADLIEDISKYTDAKRIRLGSLDPSLFTEDFVRRVCTKQIMLPHYHISMQSGCSKTLAAMRRRVNADGAHKALERIRSARPDALFSADFIVGFPGETDADFAETMEFIKIERFLTLHVFQYSKRAGTEAAARKDQVPSDVKKHRSEFMIEAQKEIHASILSSYIGKKFPLLVENIEKDENGRYFATGHTPSFIQTSCECKCEPQKGCTISATAHGNDGEILFAKEI